MCSFLLVWRCLLSFVCYGPLLFTRCLISCHLVLAPFLCSCLATPAVTLALNDLQLYVCLLNLRNTNFYVHPQECFQLQMVATVKSLPTIRETQVQSLSQEDPLEKEMATHSSMLAWKISRTEKPGGLQSVGPQRVRHDQVTNTLKWQKNLTTMSEVNRTYFSHCIIRNLWK